MHMIAKTWNEFFKEIREKDYSINLNKFLDKEYSEFTVYPARDLIFNAFKLTKLKDVKVVIIGQDPYHEPGQAMGLSFSVPSGIKVPPSLVNIYKEIQKEYDTTFDMSSGDLTYLAKQGVLMVNAILTVRKGMPMSHNIPEYKMFFKDVLEVLDKQYRPMVFMLWGGPAKKFKNWLHNPDHLVLESNHPSPLSANRGGWFNNNHFRTANEYLKKNGLKPIDWIKKTLK